MNQKPFFTIGTANFSTHEPRTLLTIEQGTLQPKELGQHLTVRTQETGTLLTIGIENIAAQEPVTNLTIGTENIAEQERMNNYSVGIKNMATKEPGRLLTIGRENITAQEPGKFLTVGKDNIVVRERGTHLTMEREYCSPGTKNGIENTVLNNQLTVEIENLITIES
jgi:hypothetical protein